MNPSRSTRRFFRSEESAAEAWLWVNHSPLAFYWGLSVPRLYLHLRKRPSPAHWYHIQVERPDILSRKLQPVPLATIPRIRPKFLAWPHTSSDPLEPPWLLGFHSFCQALGNSRAPVFPPPAPTGGKCWPSTVSTCSASSARPRCTMDQVPPGDSSLGGSGLSVPWRVTAKFPWPCVQGPGARSVGVGSLGFHVGSGQEELSCGCQLDSWALAGPGGGRAAARKTLCVWESIGGKEGWRGKAFVQAKRTETSGKLEPLPLKKRPWQRRGEGTSPGWGFSSLPCSLLLTEPNQVKRPAPAARQGGIVSIPYSHPFSPPLRTEFWQRRPWGTGLGVQSPRSGEAGHSLSLPPPYRWLFFCPRDLRRKTRLPLEDLKAVFVDIKALSEQTAPWKVSLHPRQPGTQGGFGRCGERGNRRPLGVRWLHQSGEGSFLETGPWETPEAP